MIGIAIVLTVLIVIIAVLIIHANNKHSVSGIFRNGGGGGTQKGGVVFEMGGLNPSTNYGL